MQIEGDIAGFISPLAPVGMIYGWYFYFAKFGRSLLAGEIE